MGYMDSRSATKHAGVPALVNAIFGLGAAGEKLIVKAPTDGRKIRLHSYMMSPNAGGRVTLASSGASTETELIGALEVLADSPVSQDGGRTPGLGTCALNADLAVSSVGCGVDGNVVYSLVPEGWA